MSKSRLFENDKSVAAKRWIKRRLKKIDPETDEYFVLERLSHLEFEKYPNYTAPWDRIKYPHMRWTQVRDFIEIIELFKQPTGAHIGQPIHLQPFQILILLLSLGPEDPKTNLRLVREVLLTLGRKSGKTALIAGIALVFLILHRESGGLFGQDVQVGAADREQAGITYKMANLFIAQDNVLGVSKKFRSVPSKKEISHNLTLSNMRCLSSDAYRAHGGNPMIVLIDEIGNVGHAQAEEFYSVLTSGFGAQTEPLTFLLSTQAPTDQHFFSQQVDRGKRINDGFLEDDQFAAFVFETPETDLDGNEVDPFDEKNWYLALPGLGTITSLEDMKTWAKKARELPSLENKFRNLKLNQRVSATSAFLTRRIWKRNSAKFDLDQLTGRPCYLGLDLASSTDLSCLVAVFEPLEKNNPVPLLLQFWIPGDGLQARSRQDKVPYDVWAKKGLIDVSSPKIVDYSKVAKKIIEWNELYDIQAFGYDRWNMKYVRTELLTLEFDRPDDWYIEIGQGYKDQSRSVRLMEEFAIQGLLSHNNHPILTWNVANTVIVTDPAGGRKFAKDKSFGRIDGTVATAIGVHTRDIFLARQLEVEEETKSVYESEEELIM